MRTRILVVVLGLAAASPAFASFGSDKPQTQSPQTQAMPNHDGVSNDTRKQAELWYGDAYNDIAKARQELAAGKADRAGKRFRKALERGLRAVEIDSTYHEAWNLVGYSARHLKDYDRSLAAYNKCLAIAPDFAPAREYLGEAYLELKQPERARDQLLWLEKHQAETERVGLQAAFDAYMRTAPAPAAAATRDSTGTSR